MEKTTEEDKKKKKKIILNPKGILGGLAKRNKNLDEIFKAMK